MTTPSEHDDALAAHAQYEHTSPDASSPDATSGLVVQRVTSSRVSTTTVPGAATKKRSPMAAPSSGDVLYSLGRLEQRMDMTESQQLEFHGQLRGFGEHLHAQDVATQSRFNALEDKMGGLGAQLSGQSTIIGRIDTHLGFIVALETDAAMRQHKTEHRRRVRARRRQLVVPVGISMSTLAITQVVALYGHLPAQVIDSSKFPIGLILAACLGYFFIKLPHDAERDDALINALPTPPTPPPASSVEAHASAVAALSSSGLPSVSAGTSAPPLPPLPPSVHP